MLSLACLTFTAVLLLASICLQQRTADAASSGLAKRANLTTFYQNDRCFAVESQRARSADQSLNNYLSSSNERDHRPNDVHGKSTLTIGFLTSYVNNQISLGAMSLAVEAINKDPNILPGKTLTFQTADIGTPEKKSAAALSVRVMTQMREAGVLAFIGPDDTCRTEALVAAAWNLPLISYRCADTKVSDKETYHTFARTLPPSSMVSKSIISLLKTFKWNKVSIVASLKPTWSQIRDAVMDLSLANGIIVTQTATFDGYIPFEFQKMEQIVSETYKTTRVYVFIGEHTALVDFVRCLYNRGLLKNGQYVVISVDDVIYDPDNKHRFIEREYLDPYIRTNKNNDVMKMRDMEAFRSVLKLTPTYPKNPHYAEMLEKIKWYSTQPPFCVPYHPTIFNSMQVPIHAAHLFDSVMIYARALHDVIKAGENPRNGSAILKRTINRSYHSLQGFDVAIDANGDAEGNYTLVSMLSERWGNFDTGAPHDDTPLPSSLLTVEPRRIYVNYSFHPVGYFQSSTNSSAHAQQIPELRFFDDSPGIEWVGGRIPEAEPPCGFHNERCIYRPDWKVMIAFGILSAILLVIAFIVIRHYHYQRKFFALLWKIDMRDIILLPTDNENKVVASGGRYHVPGTVSGVAGVGLASTVGLGVRSLLPVVYERVPDVDQANVT